MAADTPAPRLRWKTGLTIALVAIIAGVAAWNLLAGDRTMQVFSLYPIVSGGVFFLLLWWMLFSGVRWKTRLRGLGVVAAVAGLLLLVFRFDSFDGAMVPNFSSRFSSPIWPAAAYIVGVGMLFLSSLSWTIRGIAAAGVLVAAGTATYTGVEAFALKQQRHIPQPGEGERSKESNVAIENFRRDAKRFEETPNGDLALAEYSPSELLRLKKVKSWERWRHVDGVALAVGCMPRVLFKPETSPPEDGHWPQFRGPHRDGIIRNAGIRFDWTSDNPPPNLWQKNQAIGFGRSSFAVVGGRAYTQEQQPDDAHESVVCYDFKTGSPIWKHNDESHFEDIQGGDGPRATPTIAGRRVYTLGATGVLNCLDLVEKGKELWQRNVLEDAGTKNLTWGLSGSPLVAGNLLFVNPGGGGTSVIAYDRFNGKIVWAAGEDTGSYASLIMRRIHGVDQLLNFHGEGITAYDPNTGRQLWKSGEFANGQKINATTPIVVGNQILLSTSYTVGSLLLKVNVDAGDWTVEEVWRNKRFRLKFNDAVHRRIGEEDYIFGLNETILSCLRLSDGRIVWRRRGSQLGPGGNYKYGQILLVDDTLLITAESGWVSFVSADPQRPQYLGGFRGLNRGKRRFVDTKGVGWNQPVLVKGRLLMRNNREVACFDLSK